MFDRINSLSAAAFSLAIVASSAAMAGSTGRADAVTVPAVIGAAYSDATRASSVVDVRRQGGFATAGTALWLARAPEARLSELQAAPQPIYVPSVIGAMYESRALARNAADVSRQGGFATAGTVRWLARAPDTQAVAAF